MGRGKRGSVRVSTTPSIPSRGCTFGYEENKSGELIKLSGGNERAEVNEVFEDAVNPRKREIRGTNWHASKVARPMLLKSKENSVGPGSYEVAVSTTKRHATSCFKSAVPKLALKHSPSSSEDEDMPGPGYYDPQVKAFKRPSTSQVQKFGLTTVRFTENKGSALGPGEYEEVGTICVLGE
eukprot:TRINITY_DN11249_c0_g1_i2.p2 TRINITY_DN11249_c0_g1~~TRINITY_DN11249_c0_g1_i2.p2  ORF type:complete len:181 (-),score=21.59 TRINITY_DN11249_c0_g1_i2:198-740(-)